MFLANSSSTFYIKGKPDLNNNDSKILLGNPPDCLILENWAFDNFILAEELAAKALWSLWSCALVNNSLCGKLVPLLELPLTFDERFKNTSVPFFIPDFNLLSS